MTGGSEETVTRITFWDNGSGFMKDMVEACCTNALCPFGLVVGLNVLELCSSLKVSATATSVPLFTFNGTTIVYACGEVSLNMLCHGKEKRRDGKLRRALKNYLTWRSVGAGPII
jgi:hypothetical protein